MTRIKTCGMFRPEDIAAVNAARPDYVGFIVNYPLSHRSLNPDQVRELAAQMNPDIIKVGVFVNGNINKIRALVEDGALDMVQLHGREDESYISQLKLVCDVPVIKAFVVEEQADIDDANACIADYVLLDAGYGSGKAFDWKLMEGIKRPFFLAGGLNCENLAVAIDEFEPFAVDLSSGLETDKVKDAAKIKAAVDIVRSK